MEIWKDIEGYEGLYQVSNLGNVKSLRFGKDKVLKPIKIKNNYLRVDLFKQGKHNLYLVHRLVARAFIDNPNNLPMINHKDENTSNNKVSNLEWCDAKYNINYGTCIQRIAESNTNNQKLSKPVICIETGKIYLSTREVERELGFAHQNIVNACTGRYKQAYNFHWRYVS